MTNKQREMLDEFVVRYKSRLDAAFLINYDCTPDMLRDIDAILAVKNKGITLREIERYIVDKVMGVSNGA